jgi:hypothetical protein
MPLAAMVFAVLLPWFGDLERGVAAARNERSGGWVFRFRGQGLAAIPDADRFFFRAFDRASRRSGAS